MKKKKGKKTERMKFSKKLIKSFISNKKYFDGSKLDGVCLRSNSYDLFCDIPGKQYSLRTELGNPLIAELSKHFNVVHVRSWYLHYHEFYITEKL